jgi:hypothetical protein
MKNIFIDAALTEEDIARFRRALIDDLGTDGDYSDAEIAEMARSTLDALAVLVEKQKPTKPDGRLKDPG